MASLRLRTVSEEWFAFENRWASAGEPLPLISECLLIDLHVCPSEAVDSSYWRQLDEIRNITAILDTGSPQTILSHATWKQFENEIEWLNPVGTWPILGLAGVQGNDYRLGRIRLAGVDVHRSRIGLPPAVHIAFFLPHGAPDVNLLGLSSSLLRHRRLVHAHDDSWTITDSLIHLNW